MHRHISTFLLLFSTLLVAAYSQAQLGKGINSQSVEEFFDVAFQTQRLEHAMVGATVAVVIDGQVIFKKGYGFADIEQRIPVDPDKHLFRIASISKTFTWTAVMQLVEQGKLDLEEDIQTYLDFEIPKTYDQPIRLKHLLTHTPGFEDQNIGGYARTSDDVMPLSEYLLANMPARVRPPGIYASYSNYGAAVAGYIVERVSGMPWADYIQENILDPLNMTDTNIYQPMSEAHQSDHAKGYRSSGGNFSATDFWYEHEAPAGIMSSTANNMATWMLVHLNAGSFNEATILKPETMAQMHSELIRQHPDGLPILHGFYRSDRNGQEIFSHGGDVNQFHSNVSFFPAHNLGIFVSYNSDPSSQARSNVVVAFINHFFPAPVPDVIEPNTEVILEDYTGIWVSTRRNQSTIEKLGLLDNQFSITAMGEELSVFGQRWIPVNKDRFRAKYANRFLLFFRNEQGTVTNYTFEGGISSYERVKWNETESLNNLAFGLTFTVAIIFMGRSLFLFIYERKNIRLVPKLDRSLGFVASFLMVFLVASLLISLNSNTDAFLFGVPDSIIFTLQLAVVSALTSLVVIGLSIKQWVLKQGGLAARINYGILAIASMIYISMTWSWNLLNYFMLSN